MRPTPDLSSRFATDAQLGWPTDPPGQPPALDQRSCPHPLRPNSSVPLVLQFVTELENLVVSVTNKPPGLGSRKGTFNRSRTEEAGKWIFLRPHRTSQAASSGSQAAWHLGLERRDSCDRSDRMDYPIVDWIWIYHRIPGYQG